MSVNLFLKRRLSLLDTGTIWDLINGMYSVFRPDMTTLWTNAVFKLRRTSDNAVCFVFFDNHSSPAAEDTITTSSLISTTSNTTPDATTLTSWVGGNHAYIEEQLCITPDNTIDNNKTKVQTTTSSQPRLVKNGALEVKNSTVNVNYQSATRYLVAPSNSILDS